MKIRVSILLIVGLILCGCSDKEIYSRDYLLENGYTQFCGEYGVTYHIKENGYNIVYRSIGNNEFQEYFETGVSSDFYNLDIYDGYLYFINKYNTSHLIYAYELDGKVIDYIPATLTEYQRVKPLYVSLPSWNEDISKVTCYQDLPDNCKAYLKKIEELTSLKISMISVGPSRENTIVIEDLL